MFPLPQLHWGSSPNSEGKEINLREGRKPVPEGLQKAEREHRPVPELSTIRGLSLQIPLSCPKPYAAGTGLRGGGGVWRGCFCFISFPCKGGGPWRAQAANPFNCVQ